LNNVVPIQALVVGIVGLVVGFAWLPLMKASFAKAQQDLLKSVNRQEAAGRSGQIPQLVRGASSVISKVNDVIFTLFRWLCLAVGILASLVYIIGFFGVNLAEVLLGNR
jgi:phage-related minor tail protein